MNLSDFQCKKQQKLIQYKQQYHTFFMHRFLFPHILQTPFSYFGQFPEV